jgi:hypothetical protein
VRAIARLSGELASRRAPVRRLIRLDFCRGNITGNEVAFEVR